MTNYYPLISVIIPTYNSAGIIRKCLDSIKDQNYPKEKIEIIVADGGSGDETRKIAAEYGAKVYDNPKKTGEHGKAVAISKAKGEYLALIDSDNILTDRNYFKKLAIPLADPKVIGAQPIRFGWRKADGSINRYTAMLGMADPFILFQGTYDHYCYITDTWTKVTRKELIQDGYRIVKFTSKEIPTIGANGFIIKKSIVDKYFRGDYYVDIDVVREVLLAEPDLAIGIVNTELIHLFCDNIGSFVRKQRRRINDYLFSVKTGTRQGVIEQKKKAGQILFVLGTVTIIPLLIQMLIGMVRKFDWAWLWHPVLCWVTLWIYGVGALQSRKNVKMESRDQWKQTGS